MSDDDVLRKDSRSAGYRISCAASRLIKGLQMYAPCPSSQRDYSAHHYRVGLFAVVCNSFGDDVSGRQCHRLNGLVGRARANPWRVNFCKRCLRPPSSPPKYRVCQREEGEEEEERVGPIPLPPSCGCQWFKESRSLPLRWRQCKRRSHAQFVSFDGINGNSAAKSKWLRAPCTAAAGFALLIARLVNIMYRQH